MGSSGINRKYPMRVKRTKYITDMIVWGVHTLYRHPLSRDWVAPIHIDII